MATSPENHSPEAQQSDSTKAHSGDTFGQAMSKEEIGLEEVAMSDTGEALGEQFENKVQTVEVETPQGEEVIVSEDQAEILQTPELTEQELLAVAEELAQTEPAAGEEGGATSSGYGFNTNFNVTPFVTPEDIGPAGRTALQYSANFREGENFQVGTDEDPDPILANPDDINLDETGLSGGNLTVSGTLSADFGIDAPGTFGVNGNFTSGGSQAGGTLTYQAVPVTVTTVGNGYIGMAGGVTVFTLTVDPVTGDYTYTQIEQFDHADGTDPNDVIALEFGLTATDFNGDTANTTLTVFVADDAPLAVAPASETANEAHLSGGPIVLNGALAVDFGQDEPGTVSPDGTSSASGDLPAGGLQSGGEDVIITQTATGYEGRTAGTNTLVFDITLDPATGSYIFTLYEGLDHANPGDVITLDFGVDVQDFDGDSVSTTITVDIIDSNPHLSVPNQGSATDTVDETNITDVATGSVTVDFGADTPGTFEGTGTSDVFGLTSNGNPIVVTYDPATRTYTGTAGGTDVFRLELDANGDYTFTLLGPVDHPDTTDADDAVLVEFGVSATDSDGDTDTGTIIIEIRDDGPHARDDFRTFDQDDIFVTGNVTTNDDPSEDIDNTVTEVRFGTTTVTVPATGTTTINGTHGTLEIAADGSYTYTLNPGMLPDETRDVFYYTYTDGDGDKSEAKLKVIGNNDDEPLITNVTPVTADETEITDVETGTITVDFGADTPGTYAGDGTSDLFGLTSGGTPITVIYDPATRTYTGSANGADVFTLEINGTTGDYTFTLLGPVDHPDKTNPDDNVQVEFGVEVTDSDGDTAIGTITVTISDDGPVANDDFRTFDQDDVSVSGNVTTNDDPSVDVENTVTEVRFGTTTVAVPVSGTATINGTHGTLEIAGDGTYTYTLNPGMLPDETRDVFYYTYTDGDGDTSEAKLKIIGNNDDEPLIAKVTPLHVDETDITDVDTGSVTVDFGADAPGTIEGDGTFDLFGLTSGGTPVVVTFDAVTQTYTGTANGNDIFTLDIDTDGSYTFTLLGPVDHPDASNPDDALQVEFGVQATDSDGDTATGTITVTINDDGPVANDDSVMFDQKDVSTLGNVTTNDDFSQDVENTVTEVRFGTNTVSVPATGTATIDGDFGILEIAADGTYTYTLKSGAFSGGSATFDPVEADTNGTQESLSRNGITVSVGNTGDFDITWVDTSAGSGLGIDNLNSGDSKKIWPSGESFDITPEKAAQTVTITIAELGDNNDNGDKGADLEITLADGTVVTTEIQFDPAGINNGEFTFTLNAADYGQVIASVNLASTNAGHYGAASMLLNEVSVTYPPCDCGKDEFEYTLTDGDGDTDTAVLMIECEPNDIPVVSTRPLSVDETDITDVATGSITVDFGDDGPGTIEGNGTSDVFGLTSNGKPVEVTYDAATRTYTGTANGSDIFTLEINANGDYTFRLLGQVDHPDATDPNDAVQVEFGVSATDSDGDTTNDTITVTINDDGPHANDDFVTIGEGQTVTGNVIDNDDVGADVDGSVTSVHYDGTDYDFNGTPLTINAANGTLTINEDGSYTYTSTGAGIDRFTYKLSDFDGDTDPATLKINNVGSLFKVGENVDDDSSSTTPYRVGVDQGEITGDLAGDILVGDVGNSQLVPQEKDYNVVMILDISGSMGAAAPGTKFTLLQNAVNNLLAEFNAYTTGDIKVHIIPFGTFAFPSGTFEVTDILGFNNAQAFINGMGNNGNVYTNFEDPMAEALAWYQGTQPIAGAENVTYFVSDGEPNRYIDSSGNVRSGNANRVMDEITGTDGSNEVAGLQGFGEVISVGIGVNATTLGRLDIIDTGSDAIDVKNPIDLNSAFQNLNPLNNLLDVGDDVINGREGDDIIFGDSLFTDDLAADQGLSTPPGSGWGVFEALENSQGNDAGWDRQDTIEYIRNNAEALSEESVTLNSQTREGGNDTLNGGDGNDLIFGQEGRDVITGGEGDDTLYGGSDADIFNFDSVNDGLDTVKDFDSLEGDLLDISDLLVGYDPLQDSINDFVFATESGGNTTISVDVDGTSGTATAFNLVVLEGATGLDIAQVTNNGEEVVV